MKHKLTLTTLVLTGALTLSAVAAGVSQIKAELRPDIKIIVDGKEQVLRDSDGDHVYPITYEGTTYVPIRAVGEALDQKVEWDGKNKTVSLTDRAPAEEAARKEETDKTADKSDTAGGLADRVTALDEEADALAARADKVTDRAGWRQLRKDCEEFEKRADRLEDELERARRDGTLTAEKYRDLDRALDLAEEKADDLDDRVERRLGWDDDWDDDRDDDWDDDRDD